MDQDLRGRGPVIFVLIISGILFLLSIKLFLIIALLIMACATIGFIFSDPEKFSGEKKKKKRSLLFQ